MTDEQRRNVSKGLKKYRKNNSVWNKGLKYGKYDEPSAKRFRRDKQYYLDELKNNALRSRNRGYDKNREEENRSRTEQYNIQTGRGRPPKEWSKEEISYLRENYKKPRLEICKYLGRSWSSVAHKVERLGLQKYNKWV